MLNSGILIHPTVFRVVAHRRHTHHTLALAHTRATQQHIGGIGRGGVGSRSVSRFVAYFRFAGKRTFVHAQRNALNQFAVGRDFFARFHQHDVAHHNVAARHLHNGAPAACLAERHVAHHLHRHIVADFIEHIKFSVGIIFHQKSHQSGKHNGAKYAQGLQERFPSLARQIVQFVDGDAHRKGKSHQQNDNERVVESLQKLFPRRRALRRREHIATVLLPTFIHLAGSQTRRLRRLLSIFHFLEKI